ncbi:ATP-binding protein [Streptomyces sp. bgisy060]|uniref:ATP-binding protein n=1 Tax=Streptomyces sp. bgisy060 TaxID=3413775 RepID=UPI003EC059FD
MTTHPADQERTRRRALVAAADPERCESTSPVIDLSIQRHPGPVSGGMSREDAAVPQRLRRALRAGLNRWGQPDLVDDAELLLTELVTNAFRHAGAPTVGVRVYRQGAFLLIEINGGSPYGRVPRPTSPYDEHGRGLSLVDALASSWGTNTDGTTWCTLPLAEGTSDMAPTTPVSRALEDQRKSVRAILQPGPVDL